MSETHTHERESVRRNWDRVGLGGIELDRVGLGGIELDRVG